MDVGAALWGGIAGAVVMILVYWGFQGVGATRLDLLRLEGGILTADRGPVRYLYGGILQLVLGAVTALGYWLLLGRIDSASYVGWGALLGLAHGVLVALLLPLIARANREVRAGELATPGLAGRAYGALTPLALLLAFTVFGVWVGLFLLPS